MGFHTSSDRLDSHVSSGFSYFTSYVTHTAAHFTLYLWPLPPTPALAVQLRLCWWQRVAWPVSIVVCFSVRAVAYFVCGQLCMILRNVFPRRALTSWLQRCMCLFLGICVRARSSDDCCGGPICHRWERWENTAFCNREWLILSESSSFLSALSIVVPLHDYR